LWPLYVRGGVLPGTPPEDTNSAPLISLSMNADRKLDMHEESRVGDVESLAYVVSDDAIVDVLSSFKRVLDRFRNIGSYSTSNILGLIIGFDCCFMSNKAMFCIV
jgi:hypothetical protein